LLVGRGEAITTHGGDHDAITAGVAPLVGWTIQPRRVALLTWFSFAATAFGRHADTIAAVIAVLTFRQTRFVALLSRFGDFVPADGFHAFALIAIRSFGTAGQSRLSTLFTGIDVVVPTVRLCPFHAFTADTLLVLWAAGQSRLTAMLRSGDETVTARRSDHDARTSCVAPVIRRTAAPRWVALLSGFGQAVSALGDRWIAQTINANFLGARTTQRRFSALLARVGRAVPASRGDIDASAIDTGLAIRTQREAGFSAHFTSIDAPIATVTFLRGALAFRVANGNLTGGVATGLARSFTLLTGIDVAVTAERRSGALADIRADRRSA
jgi:hypothetical protein